jgi:medium-chain acyl-[acyl-carrier-protein] hydrolase
MKIKLFCFPYAGGSSVIFNIWKQYLDPKIELIAIELAGRGKRMKDDLYKDLPEMVEDVYKLVYKEIKGSAYAIFGHSMGGIISYQLGQKLRENNYPAPVHIFFSGLNAPHVKRPDKIIYHLLDEEEFKKALINLGGTPPEFFEHPELIEVFLPALKNDFKLAETFIYNGEIHPLDCNITVLLGKDEDFTSDQCDGWKKHTKKLCTIHYFDGGHFFLHNDTKQIVNIINNSLLSNIYF